MITGIPKAANHDGGRIAFGPDGMLYVTAGDASNRSNAQDLASLGGKILRLTPDGGVPADNPFPGSPVWSYGHRNPQGIGWDSRTARCGRASSARTPGTSSTSSRPAPNYGWPNVEGIGGDPKYTDPVYQWPTDEASPSGLAIVGRHHLHGRRCGGERLWTIWPTAGHAPVTVKAVLRRRLRAGCATSWSHGDDLWMLTNNTDGRGTPRDGDDKLSSRRFRPSSRPAQCASKRDRAELGLPPRVVW